MPSSAEHKPHSQLPADYRDLAELYREVCAERDALVEQLETFQSDYDALSNSRDEIAGDFDALIDWLERQINGCLDDAVILEQAKPLAIGRALIANLRDAHNAIVGAIHDRENAASFPASEPKEGA